MAEKPFWETTHLSEMNQEQWEALCDGCGRCCLIQLEDEETQERVVTKVACKLLDIGVCRCKSYQNRHNLVPGCTKVTLNLLKTANWLPETCAYRLLYEGKNLAPWHPLISKDPSTVIKAGISIKQLAISEDDVYEHEIEEKYVIGKSFQY